MCIGEQLRGRRAHWATAVAFLLLATLYEPPPASEAQIRLAYLDPGTGSLIIQGLIAAFAGAAVALRAYWKRIQRSLGFPPAQVDEKDTEREADLR